jgi:predicted MFS family arabinose efflux permease
VEEAWNWHVAFYTLGIGASVATALFALALKPKPPQRGASERHPLDYRPVLRNRKVMAWVYANMGHSIEFTIMRNWLVGLFATAMVMHGVSDAYGISAAWLAAVTAPLSLPSVLIGGALAKRLGDQRAMLTIMGVTLALVIAMSAALAPLAPLWLFLAIAMVYSMMISADVPMIVQGAIRESGPGDLGITLALQTIMSFVAGVPGPILLGLAIDLAGGRNVPTGWIVGYVTASVLALGSGLLAVRILRRPG